MTTRTIEIQGEIIGKIWWPAGAPAWTTVHGTWTDFDQGEGKGLYSFALDVASSGDFIGGMGHFTPNSVLVVTWHNGRETRTRVTPLEALPALADLCTEDIPDYGDDDA